MVRNVPANTNRPANLAKLLCLFAASVFVACVANAQLGPAYLQTNATAESFPLFDRTATPILISSNDWPGVIRAANDLAADVGRVTGTRPDVLKAAATASKYAVVVGTLGRSDLIDTLVRNGKLDATAIAGKWESFFLETVPAPLPGIQSALVICGSDKRGTIYGIYDLSTAIGVSPWHYWSDAAPKHHKQLFIAPGKFVTGPPSVKYRGIFINDEAPALSEWVRERYGDVPGLSGVANYGQGFYTNVFELLLRLRANYLWPAMWNNAFNEDDPNNPRLADEYGIVMGTSHQEPMLRAQKEWDRGPGRKYGNWNYNNTNQQPALHQFWREGVRRNKNYESIITMGLRAENDSGAPVGKSLTEEIVKVQRGILGDEINPDVTKVPQLWCLYKEVQGYYNEGLSVPDDVTLLWAEDNWGNLRRLPTEAERHRSGGSGIYYHFDYHGGPRSYQWINTSPIAKIWDQLSLAKQYGADRIWIVNVGHLNKSGEFPLEFFMRLAWDCNRWTSDNLDAYTEAWAAREFGSDAAKEIAELINTSTRFNGRRKPELLDPNTYSLFNYREFETVAAQYQALAARAQAVYDRLPSSQRDAFYIMVHYPIKAAAGLNAMYLAAAKNALYAKQRRASANDFAAETRRLFQEQLTLADHFNRELAGGKWNHFMDQAYIGYTSWNPPPTNNLKAVRLQEITTPEPADMSLALEGEKEPQTGSLRFHRLGQKSRYVDVFNKGQTPFEFTAGATAPWLRLSETNGTVIKDNRVEISVDWSLAPTGTTNAQLTFSGAGTRHSVNVITVAPPPNALEGFDGFVEADGQVSIEAEHYTRNLPAGSNRWVHIPNYGHTLSAMRAEGPVGTEATPQVNSPCLEYRMFLFNSDRVDVETIVSPTLNVFPDRPLRLAISFDEEPSKVVTIVPATFDARNGNRDWEESVKNNYRRVSISWALPKPGAHTLNVWMVDPAVVLQKIIVDTGDPRASYLGPPESPRN